MFGLSIPDWAVKAIAVALAAAALVLWGRWWGATGVYAEWIEANAKASAAAVKIIQKQEVVTERVRIEYRDRIVQLDGVNTTIENEVIRYVESQPAAAACLLDDRWMQLHDAAAAGTVPAATGGNDGAAGAAEATATEAGRGTDLGRRSPAHGDGQLRDGEQDPGAPDRPAGLGP